MILPVFFRNIIIHTSCIYWLSGRQNHPSLGVTVSHTAATCRKGGSNASFPISGHSHLWFLPWHTFVGSHPPTFSAPEFCPYKPEIPNALACICDYRTVFLPCCWFFILRVVVYNNILSKVILYKRLSSGEGLNHTPSRNYWICWLWGEKKYTKFSNFLEAF